MSDLDVIPDPYDSTQGASMSLSAVSPAEDLDARPGVYPAFLLPFDEPARPDHEHAGRSYGWADVRLPKKAEVLLTVDHDDADVVGLAFGFAKTREGVTCRVKLGRRGEELVRLGRVGISAEVNEDTGEIFGASLCMSGVPGFSSARIMVDPVPETASGRVSAGPSASGLSVEFGGGSISVIEPKLQPLPPPARTPALDLTPITAYNAAMSMAAVHAEVAQVRERFQRRQVELAEAPALEEEGRLIAACVPTSQWPAHLPGRRRYDEFVAQREAAERHEYEARRTVQLLEYELAAAAVPSEPAPRRSWWWRLKRGLRIG